MNRLTLLVISLVLFVVGLVLLFNSVSWGMDMSNAYLRSQGGSMDSTQFTVVMQGYMQVFRWTGGILSLLGGLGALQALERRG